MAWLKICDINTVVPAKWVIIGLSNTCHLFSTTQLPKPMLTWHSQCMHNAFYVFGKRSMGKMAGTPLQRDYSENIWRCGNRRRSTWGCLSCNGWYPSELTIAINWPAFHVKIYVISNGSWNNKEREKWQSWPNSTDSSTHTSTNIVRMLKLKCMSNTMQ